jgi:hypothetical protein
MVASAGHTPYLASLNGLCASHDTSLVAYAPAMIRHQNGRVSEMTDNAIEHLVVGEATVTTAKSSRARRTKITHKSPQTATKL